MTGLRQYDRDGDLPAICGNPELVPVTVKQVTELVHTHLMTPNATAIRSVQWEYARWKPGVSITTVHSLILEDDSEHKITVKQYAGDKASVLDQKASNDARITEQCAPLIANAQLPERRIALSVFPADRQLRGVVRLLDRRRTSRMLTKADWCPPRSIKKRSMEFELLRFKPEHRAVYKLQLKQRCKTEPGLERSLAARVLPLNRFQAIAQNHSLFDLYSGRELGPELVIADFEAGLLIESWLDIEVLESHQLSSFERSFVAGELLGKLHRTHSCSADRVISRGKRASSELFQFDSQLAQLAAQQTTIRSSASPTWCHGDFHPDQVGRRRSDQRWQLLDFDELAIGDPVEDLASWIADRLALDPECSFELAGDELLQGYRCSGGERFSRSELAGATACALVRLAAGVLRRLERDAIDKSTRLLRLANEISPARSRAV